MDRQHRIVFNDGTDRTRPRYDLADELPFHEWGRPTKFGKVFIFDTHAKYLGRPRYDKYRTLLYQFGYPDGTIATIDQLDLMRGQCAFNRHRYSDFGNTCRFYTLGPIMPPGYQWCRVGDPARATDRTQSAELERCATWVERVRLQGVTNGVINAYRACPALLKTKPYERIPYEELAAAIGLDTAAITRPTVCLTHGLDDRRRTDVYAHGCTTR